MQSVCVYCGSSPGLRPDYTAAAQELGSYLVQRHISLVYGGGRVGLMGEIANSVLTNGGRVVGIIPRHLQQKEVAHDQVSELIVVDSMHDRKARMAELADAFIALPGGLGTMDEMFEILTWSQLGLHGNPCGLLNVAGYFDNLIAFLDHMVEERFVSLEHRALLQIEQTPHRLLDRLSSHVPIVTDKWLDRA